MKLRRILIDRKGIVQAASNGGWVSLAQVDNLNDFALAFGAPADLDSNLLSVLALGDYGWSALQKQVDKIKPTRDTGADLMPFRPASFRDFMLYEDHAISASRAYARHFMPKKYRATRVIEKFTGLTFLAFKPRELWYKQPIYYFGNHINIGLSGDSVIWPSYTQALDYELELGAILAHPLRNATTKEAKDAVGGFLLLNNFSARDIQLAEMDSGFGPQKCKHFFSSISSVVLTADEIKERIDHLEGSVIINGQKVATCSSAGSRFTLFEAVAHASKSELLVPGELFGSGTLPGGAGLENDCWLRVGDEIELCLDALRLKNSVVRETRTTGFQRFGS